MNDFELYNDSILSINNQTVNKLIDLVLGNYGFSSAKISIIITDDNKLRKMKKKYFNVDTFTDVIAFNLEDDPFEGEIYISYERVKENALNFNQSINDEMKRVMIHGLLHLCGFEDFTKEDKKQMTSLEDDFMKKNEIGILVN